MKHNEKSVLRHVGLIFLPVSLKVVIFLKKLKEVAVSKSHGYMILLLPYNGELQKLLYI